MAEKSESDIGKPAQDKHRSTELGQGHQRQGEKRGGRRRRHRAQEDAEHVEDAVTDLDDGLSVKK